ATISKPPQRPAYRRAYCWVATERTCRRRSRAVFAVPVFARSRMRSGVQRCGPCSARPRMPDRPGFEHKIVERAGLPARVAALERPIVFTNGVFDILHRGHVTYLARARALGASLVVALNSDQSVRQLGKGNDRPINPQDDRGAVLAALESVSLVTLFD